MMPPRISVIIPTYNRPELTARALRSVTAQDYPDYEILVVDDGSQTSYESLKVDFPQVRWVRHTQNRGAAAARNTGVQQAGGAWAAFLDSDDEWLPGKLKRQVEWLEAYPALDACTTGFRYTSPEGDGVRCYTQPEHWIRFLSKGMGLGAGTTLMARRETMLQIPYNEHLPRHEDYDWALRFVQQYSLGVVPEVLAVVYRGRNAGAPAVEQANLHIVHTYRPVIAREGAALARQFEGKRWMEVATLYFREKNFQKGVRYLWKAMKANPFQSGVAYLRLLDAMLNTNLVKFSADFRGRLGHRFG